MNARRLLKLAEHLETGKLGHKIFDFDHINYGKRDERGCGTNGCAIGELPIVFPRSFKFHTYENIHWDGDLTYIPNSGLSAFPAAEDFFGISSDETEKLFCPYGNDGEEWGKLLDNGATRKQVAKNIRAFVAWKQSQ